MLTKSYYCRFVQGGLTLWPNNKASACCLSLYSDSFEASQWTQTNPDCFDQNTWSKWRTKLQDTLRNGIVPSYCQGCPCLQPFDQEALKNGKAFFTEINIINLQLCTLACNFCYLSTILDEQKMKTFDPHFGMFQDIVDKGLVNQHSLISWGGGEPSIHPKLRELYELFRSAGCRQHFDTNATRYMDFIENDIRSGMTTVSCSLISSCHETYKSVMRRDLFHAAWENAQKYASHGGIVRAKMILLSENEGEEKLFIEKCKKCHIDTVNVDIEISKIKQQKNYFSKRIANIVHYAHHYGVNIFFGVGITYITKFFYKRYAHELNKIQTTMLNTHKNNLKRSTIQLKIVGRNTHSLSNQVFLLGVQSDINSYTDLSRLKLRKSEAWKCETSLSSTEQKYYLSDQTGSFLEFDIDYISRLKLRFIAHRWSGIVSVTVDGHQHGVLDLFSDIDAIVTYDILARLMSTEKRIAPLQG